MMSYLQRTVHKIVYHIISNLKMHGPIFHNLVFCFIWRIITPRMLIWNFGWNGQAVLMYEATLYIAVAYILLCTA